MSPNQLAPFYYNISIMKKKAFGWNIQTRDKDFRLTNNRYGIVTAFFIIRCYKHHYPDLYSRGYFLCDFMPFQDILRVYFYGVFCIFMQKLDPIAEV